MNPFVVDVLRPVLNGKKILLGITGSIAAFKACDVIRILRSCGAEVRVVLTKGGENFVTRTTLETLSGNLVLSDFWDTENHGTHHIDTARWADLILVAPATGNIIAKMAAGMADDLLTTEILAFKGPLCVVPAMNPAMFAHAAVQSNLNVLSSRAVRILGPTSGLTSCGEEGLGRMLEPAEIVEEMASSFYSEPTGKRILISLGPTRSSVDPVRYLTNRSSGLMGVSLCWAAVQAGYEVTAVCGPIEGEMRSRLPRGIRVISVESAHEMADAVLSHWVGNRTDGIVADIFISTAAVLDWDIKNPARMKLKKESGAPSFELVRNTDILAKVSELRTPSQTVVGFAAETESPIENAIHKLRTKGCDAIFANQVNAAERGQKPMENQKQTGFESAFNSGWWITHRAEGASSFQAKIEEGPNSSSCGSANFHPKILPLEMMSKPELARKMIALIAEIEGFDKHSSLQNEL